MLSEKELIAELKRYPGFIRKAIRDGDLSEAFARQVEMQTIQWILEQDATEK